MPLLYEINEHKKDGHKFAQITGFEGRIADLKVPEIIEGYPVEAIGNHAFSGRDDLVTVTLPETVKTLYGFSFHNCKNLRKISLFDSLDDYYDGVCRQCDNLEEVDITIEKNWYEVIRNFLADNDKTLRFVIHAENGTSCLTFPEYVYDFNENTMARTIQFSIAGSGYAFRECVDRRKIDYRQYDGLFEKAIVDGSEIAGDIAIGRLLYPVDLSGEHCHIYERYVRNNSRNILEGLIREYHEQNENQEILDNLKKLLEYRCDIGKLKMRLFTQEDIDAGIKLASELKLNFLIPVMMNLTSKSADSPKIAPIFEF